MAVAYSTSAADKRMVQWWSGDTTTGWGGPNDGLDTFGAEIEGSSCVVIAARKNENLTITYTATLSSVPAGSQLIFNTYTIIGNVLNSLSIDVNDGASGTANFNILPEFTGTASSLNLKSFVAIAMDLGAGTLNAPTNNLAGINYNLVVQNVNIRATDNFFLDAASVGDGITITGTTVSDTLFAEAQAFDISNDDHFGVLQEFEGVIFAQHDVDIDTTTGNSTGENLTFVETLNGSNSYELGGSGTAVFDGTNIQTTGTVTCTIDMSSMTSFSMTAGSMNNITTITFGSGQTITRANFNDITTFNTGSSTFTDNTLNTVTTANISTASSGLRLQSVTTPNVTANLTDCIVNDSGRVDITSGSVDLTDCSFTDTSATTSAVLANASTIANITGTSFTRTSGTTNAVDLGDIGSSLSVNWDGNTLTGYGTQLAGENISSTAGGAIKVNFISIGIETLTINVLNGATVPTVEISGTAGCTVDIVQSVTISLTQMKDGTEVRVFDSNDTTPPYAAGNELAGVETLSGGVGTGLNNGTAGGSTDNNSFTFTMSQGATVFIRVFNENFITTPRLIELTPSSDQTLQIAQTRDRVFQ